LRESQARLEDQQAELEQTNAQLEEQTQALERQRDDLSRAQVDLVEKADELTRANRYKSEFLANMSHELRTPLNSALILAKLLADNKNGNLTPEQVRYAATIYSSGNDLLVLINDILDLSRIEAGRMELQVEAVDLARTIESLRRTFLPVAAERHLSFEVELAPGAPASIASDGLRIQQILRNLLANAFKFTQTGAVSLRVWDAPGGCVSFSVSDSGIGIAADQQQIIFEAFRQANGTTNRSYGGTGLGLTISRELARRLAATSRSKAPWTRAAPSRSPSASDRGRDPRRLPGGGTANACHDSPCFGAQAGGRGAGVVKSQSAPRSVAVPGRRPRSIAARRSVNPGDRGRPRLRAHPARPVARAALSRAGGDHRSRGNSPGGAIRPQRCAARHQPA